MGIDPQTDRARIREITGVQLQMGAFPAKLRVGEIIDMYQSFYRRPADPGELAGALGLSAKRRSYYRSQRCGSLAPGLVVDCRYRPRSRFHTSSPAAGSGITAEDS
jgi:ABC-type multidrug transport system ATPase subunit